MRPSRSVSLLPATRSDQDQRPPLATAALVRLAVISVIVLCLLASFAYAASRHLTGPADSKTVPESVPTDFRLPSNLPSQPRLGPLGHLDLRRNYHDWETHVA
jgi:hypothetical protein